MSNGATRRLVLLLRLLRQEGPAAVRDRILDRLAERRRQLLTRTVDPDAFRERLADVPQTEVINFSPLGASPRRGGAQIQLFDRLREEARLRTVTLVFRHGAKWRIAWFSGGRRMQVPLNQATSEVAAITAACEQIGTDLVHVECLAGMPLDLAPALARRKHRVILSVHDFSLYCRRPHLFSPTEGRFCSYCAEMRRCLRCLRHDWRVDDQWVRRHRDAAGETLAAAQLVIFPSGFLRDQYLSLFPVPLASTVTEIIAPQTRLATAAGTAVRRSESRVAFVGGLKQVKGGADVAEIWSRIRAQLGGAEAVALGEGEPELLMKLRTQEGLRIRGYYRSGHLVQQLAIWRAGVAILPSVVPESYGLVVDECLRAAVPVVAYDLGAVGERLCETQGVRLVPFANGAAGLATAALQVLAMAGPAVPEAVRDGLPNLADTAAAHVGLYQGLQLDDADRGQS